MDERLKLKGQMTVVQSMGHVFCRSLHFALVIGRAGVILLYL